MDEKRIEQIYRLIRSASTDLPEDVENALRSAKEKEPPGGTSANTFEAILENVRMAREKGTPICQDTGSLIFYVDHPAGASMTAFRREIEAAAARATKDVLLRPNAVDPVTGKNSGNNVGVNAPYITFTEWEKPEIRVRLMLKGGGSENVGTQYKLPDGAIGAGRDLEGIRRAAIDAIVKAQGKGCAPGVVGIGIGGDRSTSYLLSKKLFFRPIGSSNEDPALDALEKRLHGELNRLGIGPMGFGGGTTVLDVFIGAQHRHPATFFVAVSYMCWACRRKSMTIRNGEADYD
ncbi:MAG: fumarate hydratase [Candidatus Eisenbacteria bacterium]|nr:fumarate hydratase [Candidatus Eisenbacteria bacterium]